mmetsp:Transcript_47831/g.133091  ORF Transcript_47831/g.133091 Transcript_47831/m.133091 type:complete len:146 (+) Transcript_47831:895-1332(+)
MFFSSTHFITRIAIRGVYLPFVKYVWVHLILTAIEGLHVDHEKNRFLILTIPMAVVTAAGHLMSFATGSLFEAMAMEGLSAGFEVLEYYTYLRGKTHIDKIWLRMTWAQRTMCGKVAKVAAASEDEAETAEERAERGRGNGGCTR